MKNTEQIVSEMQSILGFQYTFSELQNALDQVITLNEITVPGSVATALYSGGAPFSADTQHFQIALGLANQSDGAVAM